MTARTRLLARGYRGRRTRQDDTVGAFRIPKSYHA